MQRQRIILLADDDPGAEELEFVAMRQLARGTEFVAIDLERSAAPDRLHERLAIQFVEDCDRAAAGSGQANLAIRAGTQAQRQVCDV